MSIQKFDIRGLLVCNDDAAAYNINQTFDDVGLLEMDLELSPGNVLNKLQDPDYKFCLVCFDTVEEILDLFLDRLRSNPTAARVPIVVYVPDAGMDLIEDLYNEHVLYVIGETLDSENASKFVWMLNAFLSYVDDLRQLPLRSYT
jgi:hypothetical protein